MTGLDGGVRREHAHLAHPRQIKARLARTHQVGGIREAAHELERQQRRVAFVHVVLADVEAEGTQYPESGDAQHRFLLEAVDGFIPVETIRDGAVIFRVERQVGIEQDDRHLTACEPFDQVEPGAHPYVTTLDCHGNASLQASRVRFGIPGLRLFALPPVGVDLLPEVAGSAHQRDGNEGNLEIGGRSDRIPGQDAEATCVRGHLRPQRDFHREVADSRLAGEALNLFHDAEG